MRRERGEVEDAGRSHNSHLIQECGGRAPFSLGMMWRLELQILLNGLGEERLQIRR